MSAAIFTSPNDQPYVLCLTSPSSERAINGGRGEWSSIFSLPSGPSLVPVQLEHNIEHLREAVLAGTATARGDLVAVREAGGRLKILSLSSPANSSGGLCCSKEPTTLDFRLCSQSRASPTSIRFQASGDGLFLFAIDIEGKIVRRLWSRTLVEYSRAPSPAELA